ncbi:hypothetical protein ACH5RR_034471 [Cinchona calisaya]|uniref:Uncharacterized protein n=1 Tax=Cinchona calisaya TaxID=153742 RepID=A0ABD2YEM0_9GENT
MEKHKLKYLQDLLARRAESNVESYIRALILLEEKARKAYAEEIIYSKNDFVEMLLLDGCFIIEFFRKYRNPGLRNVDDPILEFDVESFERLNIVRKSDPIFYTSSIV